MMPRRPFALGRRGAVVVVLLALGALAYQRLGLEGKSLLPRSGGAQVLRAFFAAALRPALDYEDPVPGAGPFLVRLFVATWSTLVYAAAAMGLALAGGLVLGVLASSSWWAGDAARPVGSRRGATWRRAGALLVQLVVRLFIAGLRSVHELLWAVLLLCALGLTSASAVVAIALPYAGTLAKIFAEMLDESSPTAANALRGAGLGPAHVFLFGRLPRALPDMLAYAFYRFECAVRSAAVLGFFGFQTLGYFLRSSFDNLHYREVWSYLYAFLFVVLVFEGWSLLLRRRFVA